MRRPPPRPLAVALGAVALLALTAPAGAYVRTTTETGKPFFWPSPCVTVVVYLGDPPPDLTAEEMLRGTQEAATTWSRTGLGCSGLQIFVSPANEATANATSKDRANRIMFRRDRWARVPADPDEPAYASNALAIASVTAVRSTGEIVDADIEINAVDFNWGDLVARGTTLAKQSDFQNTLTHELGHLIGLEHTCYGGGPRPQPLDHRGELVPSCRDGPLNPEIVAATMFASVNKEDTTRRDLAPDDIEAVCAVYPAENARMCSGPRINGEDDGGCALDPRGARNGAPPALLALVAVTLMALARRRRG